MMDWLQTYWPLFAASPVLLASIAGGFKLASHWLDVQLGRRKQTDDMALQSNAQWQDRVAKVEADCVTLRSEMKAERELCDRQLSELRHSLANEVMSWEALATGIQFRPDSAAQVLAHVEALRARRREENLQERKLRLAEARHVERGALRTIAAQAASGAHVAEQVAKAAAA